MHDVTRLHAPMLFSCAVLLVIVTRLYVENLYIVRSVSVVG